MKPKLIELAKKILEGKISRTEREALEDQLVEAAYQIVKELEVTPEELETARDDKRAKNLPLSNLKEIESKLMKESDKKKVVENVGDVLEIVETYTAKN